MTALSHPTLPLIDLDLLRTVEAIAESGSFAGAGEIVHRSPSAISMQVRRLEETLGRPVFLRDTRTVTLTADGEYLLGHARRMLAANREAMARFVAPEARGTVRLAATDDMVERFLPSMLRRFADSHPGVIVDVTVGDSVGIRAQFKAGAIDIALVTSSSAAQTDALGETVLRERLVWGCCRGGTAPLRDPLPLAVWEQGCAWRSVSLSALKAAGRRWRIALQSAHISGQRVAILADLAIAPLPSAALGGDVVRAGPEHGLPELPGYTLRLLLADDCSEPVRAAADHLRACFRAHGV